MAQGSRGEKEPPQTFCIEGRPNHWILAIRGEQYTPDLLTPDVAALYASIQEGLAEKGLLDEKNQLTQRARRHFLPP